MRHIRLIFRHISHQEFSQKEKQTQTDQQLAEQKY